jgi:D-Tyr-tRNAtyr deacylase
LYENGWEDVDTYHRSNKYWKDVLWKFRNDYEVALRWLHKSLKTGLGVANGENEEEAKGLIEKVKERLIENKLLSSELTTDLEEYNIEFAEAKKDEIVALKVQLKSTRASNKRPGNSTSINNDEANDIISHLLNQKRYLVADINAGKK